FFLQELHDKMLVRIRLVHHNPYGVFLAHLVLFYRVAWVYMHLNVVLLNILIKAITHMYGIFILLVDVGTPVLAVIAVSFWGVLGLDLLHKRNRFFCFLVLFGNKCKSLYIQSLIIFTPFLKSCK